MLINAIELSNYWNNLSLICTIMTQSAPKITAAIINRNIAFCTYSKKILQVIDAFLDNHIN